MTQQFELFCAGTLPGELAGLDQGRVLAAGSMHSSVLVQRLAVRSLLPCVWLNDEVLNFAMWELQQRDGGVSCHFFPISFMTQFRAHLSYAAVKRHTTPAALARAGVPHATDGVLSCSLVVAPVNVGGIHWTLVVADLDRQRILYIDPKGGRGRDIADAIAAWVMLEASDKRREEWDTSAWPRRVLTPGVDIPVQGDDHSCGVYAVVLAECLGAGVPLQRAVAMCDADAVAVRARLLDSMRRHGRYA